jgi:hypothetical protein
VSIRNSGTGTLIISAATLSADTPSDFSIDGYLTFPISIAPGQSGSIGVFFNPTISGLRTGTLVVQDSAPGNPHDISLTGTGIGDGQLGLSPDAGANTSIAVNPGDTAMYNLEIAAGNGFSADVSLSCSGLPQGANCTFPCFLATCFPAQLTGPQLAGTSMWVSTASSSTATPSQGSVLKMWSPLVALAGVVLMHRRQRSRQSLVVGFLILAMASCSGPGQPHMTVNPATPPGTYPFSVIATYGGQTLSTQFTLIVN